MTPGLPSYLQAPASGLNPDQTAFFDKLYATTNWASGLPVSQFTTEPPPEGNWLIGNPLMRNNLNSIDLNQRYFPKALGAATAVSTAPVRTADQIAAEKARILQYAPLVETDPTDLHAAGATTIGTGATATTVPGWGGSLPASAMPAPPKPIQPDFTPWSGWQGYKSADLNYWNPK